DKRPRGLAEIRGNHPVRVLLRPRTARAPVLEQHALRPARLSALRPRLSARCGPSVPRPPHWDEPRLWPNVRVARTRARGRTSSEREQKSFEAPPPHAAQRLGICRTPETISH